MPLLRRKARTVTDPVQGTADFWEWWSSEGARRTAEAIAAETLDAWASTISEHVDAVHPELAWELGPGSTSEHVLVVTAEGDPALRSTARRWRRAAPSADAVWEYSDVRLPAAGLTWSLGLDGETLDAGGVRVGATVHGSAVDVVVHHPAFARMPKKAQQQAMFLMLDNGLGEALVETWVGEVSPSATEPQGAVDLLELRAVVAALETEHIDEHGSPTWSVLNGEAHGRPALAMAQVPLRPMTAPHLDTHVEVTLRYPDDGESGMPDAVSLTALRDLEDHLANRLGDSGRVLAHETSAGSRRLHVYVDGTTPAVEQVRTALSAWQGGPPGVAVDLDPAWAAVAHLRG